MYGIMQLIAKACTVIALMLPYCDANTVTPRPWYKMSFYPVAGSAGIGAFDSGLTCPLAMSKSVSGGNVVCTASSPNTATSVSATFPCVPMTKVTITTADNDVCNVLIGASIKSLSLGVFENECSLYSMVTC
eukprot:CFRG0819T1